MLEGYENRLCEYGAGLEELAEIVRVMDVSEVDFRLCNDMKKERILCFARNCLE